MISERSRVCNVFVQIYLALVHKKQYNFWVCEGPSLEPKSSCGMQGFIWAISGKQPVWAGGLQCNHLDLAMGRRVHACRLVTRPLDPMIHPVAFCLILSIFRDSTLFHPGEHSSFKMDELGNGSP